MWDVCDVGCFGMRYMECGMFAGMWGVYLKDPDIGMSDVRDVGCGMWDTGLQNSNIFWYFADFGCFPSVLKIDKAILTLNYF